MGHDFGCGDRARRCPLSVCGAGQERPIEIAPLPTQPTDPKSAMWRDRKTAINKSKKIAAPDVTGSGGNSEINGSAFVSRLPPKNKGRAVDPNRIGKL